MEINCIVYGDVSVISVLRLICEADNLARCFGGVCSYIKRNGRGYKLIDAFSCRRGCVKAIWVKFPSIQ